MDCQGVLYIFKYYHTRFAYNMQIGKTSIGTKLITEYYICIHLWAYYLFVVIFNENCVLQNDLVVFSWVVNVRHKIMNFANYFFVTN